jgi:hypothetical protein
MATSFSSPAASDLGASSPNQILEKLNVEAKIYFVIRKTKIKSR